MRDEILVWGRYNERKENKKLLIPQLRNGYGLGSEVRGRVRLFVLY